TDPEAELAIAEVELVPTLLGEDHPRRPLAEAGLQWCEELRWLNDVRIGRDSESSRAGHLSCSRPQVGLLIGIQYIRGLLVVTSRSARSDPTPNPLPGTERGAFCPLSGWGALAPSHCGGGGALAHPQTLRAVSTTSSSLR